MLRKGIMKPSSTANQADTSSLESRSLTTSSPNAPQEAEQPLEDPVAEARRVVQRLKAIVEDHRQSCLLMGITLGAEDLKLVISALRKHERGEERSPVAGARDEIHGYCLNRLFEELGEEPSHILFPTKKADEPIRYEVMSTAFWGECLDFLELAYCP